MAYGAFRAHAFFCMDARSIVHAQQSSHLPPARRTCNWCAVRLHPPLGNNSLGRCRANMAHIRLARAWADGVPCMPTRGYSLGPYGRSSYDVSVKGVCAYQVDISVLIVSTQRLSTNKLTSEILRRNMGLSLRISSASTSGQHLIALSGKAGVPYSLGRCSFVARKRLGRSDASQARRALHQGQHGLRGLGFEPQRMHVHFLAPAPESANVRREFGTYKTVKARFWPLPSDESPENLSTCSLFARKMGTT